MADLTITEANVAIGGSGARTKVVQYGETMGRGVAAYLKASDGKYWKADANASAEAASATAVTLVGAAGDAYGLIQEYGPIVIGATVTLGVPYIVSTTAGLIAPASDFSGYSSTVYLTHLGYATTTTIIDLRPAVLLVSK